MQTGSAGSAKILLKARPTPAQIADRLEAPVPDGIELYLDVADIGRGDWQDYLPAVATLGRPDAFSYVVEGPLRSLDGAFFDATCFNEANREVLDRVIYVGRQIGAQAAVIHAMAARPSAKGFGRAAHAEALEQAADLFRYYSTECIRANMVPTVENVPPVARMREGSYMYSLIGTPPADIAFFVDAAPGLRVTIDVSHAQLYCSGFTAEPNEVPDALRPMVEFIQGEDGVRSLDAYIDRLAAHVAEAHISNAQGLLGEGLPYEEGELNLDQVVLRLSQLASFLVTETIEPNADRAVFMRQAQRRMLAALGRDLGRKD